MYFVPSADSSNNFRADAQRPRTSLSNSEMSWRFSRAWSIKHYRKAQIATRVVGSNT
jgi:hypothetical protein